MKISQLLDKIDFQIAQGALDCDITDITDDSRQVRPGALFIARDGSASRGVDFVPSALARGALAIVAQTPPPTGITMTATNGQPVAWVMLPQVDQTLVSTLANRFFDYPHTKLRLIGITGTNGKTTIAYLVRHLLNTSGVHCGLIGTVEVDDGRNILPAGNTTPGGVQFIRILSDMVAHGCKVAVAEVSSHALHQGRVAGVEFAAAVFTNLTGDHLDYHHTMEQYADAKAMLFDSLRPDAWAILNADDPYSNRMVRDCKARKLWCTLQSQATHQEALGDERTTFAQIIELAGDHSHAQFDGPWGSCDAILPLVGRHNIANVLQAITVANIIYPLNRTLKRALNHCPAPPGRLEPVRVGDAKLRAMLPKVLVDYAHTHDALQNVLSSLRPVCQGKLVAVFGCGGNRDTTKRPKMAQVACSLADKVIITSDNPRNEDPQDIIRQIMAGVPENRAAIVQVEPDRAQAIEQAIQMAGAHDIVLIAGKGHEDYQIIGSTRRHFDDRQEAQAALEKRLSAITP